MYVPDIQSCLGPIAEYEDCWKFMSQTWVCFIFLTQCLFFTITYKSCRVHYFYTEALEDLTMHAVCLWTEGILYLSPSPLGKSNVSFRKNVWFLYILAIFYNKKWLKVNTWHRDRTYDCLGLGKVRLRISYDCVCLLKAKYFGCLINLV